MLKNQKLLDGQVGEAAALAEFEQGVALETRDRERLKKKGRPKAARNRAVDQADGDLTACRKCGSTRRAPYFNRRDVEVEGVHLVTRKPYTKIVIRRTSCLDCGQHRDDRHFVYEPKARGKK